MDSRQDEHRGRERLDAEPHIRPGIRARFNYYYQRGARLLKRRVADVAGIFANPTGWPEPEVLAEGFEERPWDAGNVNVTALGNRHFAATYTGTTADTAVVVVSAFCAGT